MFDDITQESIRADILARMVDWDVREGEFASDLAAAVSYQIWELYQVLRGMLSIVFVDEGSGGFIDLWAATLGMSRKEGSAASGVIQFEGTAGLIIPAGTIFLTANAQEFSLLADVTLDADGSASGKAQAVQDGAAGNIEAGELVRMYVNMTGLTHFTNEVFTGGTDAESDLALVTRYALRRMETPASGNLADYRQWALAVDGVGAVRVVDLEDGPGTVGILLADSNMQPASDDIVAEVVDYIESMRPIGMEAAPHVRAGTALPIDIAAEVTLDGSIGEDELQAALAQGLADYLAGIVFTDANVLYSRVLLLLLSIDGVLDFQSLTLNGTEGNIAVDYTEIPVVGTVEVTAR